MTIFDGKAASQEILTDLKTRIHTDKLDLQLATILVGEDKASKIYTDLKKKAAESIGIKMDVYEFSEETSPEKIKNKILDLNSDQDINGIMIQLPLPKNFNKEKIVQLIKPEKDVDGLRTDSKFLPATVRAVLTILEKANALNKKTAVVGVKGTVGRGLVKSSQITVHRGFDMGDDLKNLNAYDVIISATGVADLIKPEMIKEGVVLIDVGAPKPEFNEGCYKKASFYTPVPGGVGPMTIASLLQNLVEADIIAK